MITEAQAKEFLTAGLGVSLPDFFVSAAVAKVATFEAAQQAAGYDAATITLQQTQAVAIVALSMAPRRISSQGAPSGASRSFTNTTDALTQLGNSLATSDTQGVLAEITGQAGGGGFFRVIGGG